MTDRVRRIRRAVGSCLSLAAVLGAGCSSEAQPATDGPPGGGRDDLAMIDFAGAAPDLRPPAPVVTSVSPDRGPTTMAITVQIKGANFADGATVEIGGKAAAQVVFSSTMQLLALTPERPGMPGTVPVKVTNPDGQSASLANGFTYQVTTLSFGPAQPFPTGGTGTWSGVVVDLDKDGKPDVVVSNLQDATLSALRNGGGTLGAPVTSPTGKKPTGLASADLDGDGWPDVVVAENGADAVGLFLGDGKGALVPRVPLPLAANAGPSAIAIADLDGNGKPDLVTADRGDQTVAVLLGAGGGKFGMPLLRKVGAQFPSAVAAGTFAPDTRPGLLVGFASGSGAALLHGAGDGTFSSEMAIALGGAATAFVTGDLDQDGRADVAVASVSVPEVRVLLGGAMGLGAPKGYPAGMGPSSLAAADFDKDGKLDLVAANNTSNDLTVLLGKGDGTFSAGPIVPAAHGVSWVGAADFDGDGFPDLAATSLDTKEVQIFKNTIH